MKISIICGSHRPHSESGKISAHINKQLIDGSYCDQTYLFSLANNPLPLWQENIWEGDAQWAALLAPIADELASSDAFVIVAPEWHGMVPAGLKNFFLMWGNGELAHKPALIVTVSTADGGTYPVAELRMSSYKNNRICYLPEHLIIRYADKVFNEDPTSNDSTAQPYFEQRLDYCLTMLKEYGLAFQQIRASGATDLSKFKSGM
jgi:NAD(P)H-dependent FMN reductase